MRSSKPAKNCLLGRSCGSSCVSKLDKCRDASATTKALAATLLAKGPKLSGPRTETSKLSLREIAGMKKVMSSKSSLLALRVSGNPHFLRATVPDSVIKNLAKSQGLSTIVAKLWAEQRGKDFFTGLPIRPSEVKLAQVVEKKAGGRFELLNLVGVANKIAAFKENMNQAQTAKALVIAGNSKSLKARETASIKDNAHGVEGRVLTKTPELAKLDRLFAVYNKAMTGPETSLNERKAQGALDKMAEEFVTVRGKLLSKNSETFAKNEMKKYIIDPRIETNPLQMKAIQEHIQIHGKMPSTFVGFKRAEDTGVSSPHADDKFVYINSNTRAQIIFHEMSHHREDRIPSVKAASQKYQEDNSTNGRKIVKLNSIKGFENDYDDDETGHAGKFPTPYFGRRYSDGGTEVHSSSAEFFGSSNAVGNGFYEARQELGNYINQLGLKEGE